MAESGSVTVLLKLGNSELVLATQSLSLSLSLSPQAWVVMLASFVCNGLVLGLNNAYGVIYDKLNEQLEDQSDPNAGSKAGAGDKPESQLMLHLCYPFNIASVHLLMGCPNARAGVKIVGKKTYHQSCREIKISTPSLIT